MYKTNPFFSNIARLLQVVVVIGVCWYLIPRIMPNADKLAWTVAAIATTYVFNLLLDGLLWKSGERYIRILPVLVWLWSAVLIGGAMIVRLAILTEKPLLTALLDALMSANALKGESGPYISLMIFTLGLLAFFIMTQEDTAWTYAYLAGYPIVIRVILILPCIIYIPAIMIGFSGYITTEWEPVIFIGIGALCFLIALLLGKKEAQHVETLLKKLRTL